MPSPSQLIIEKLVRRICDEQKMTPQQTEDIVATVWCESGMNPKAKNENRMGGKLFSTDWGIAQINDYYHIGKNKDFPSVEYVLNNPEKCIEWMCKMWKNGNPKWWICYKGGGYKKYLKAVPISPDLIKNTSMVVNNIETAKKLSWIQAQLDNIKALVAKLKGGDKPIV